MLRLSPGIEQRTPTAQYVRVPTVLLLLLCTYLLVDLSYFRLLVPMCVKLYSRNFHPGSVIKCRNHIVVPLHKRILVLVSSLQSELF